MSIALATLTKNTEREKKEITYGHKTTKERNDNEITKYDCNTGISNIKGQSFYRTLIGNHKQSIKWYHFNDLE